MSDFASGLKPELTCSPDMHLLENQFLFLYLFYGRQHHVVPWFCPTSTSPAEQKPLCLSIAHQTGRLSNNTAGATVFIPLPQQSGIVVCADIMHASDVSLRPAFQQHVINVF